MQEQDRYQPYSGSGQLIRLPDVESAGGTTRLNDTLDAPQLGEEKNQCAHRYVKEYVWISEL